jgi:serine/threonine protein kinase
MFLNEIDNKKHLTNKYQMGNENHKPKVSNIKGFDTRVSKWDLASQDIVNSRIKNYEEFKSIKIDGDCICLPKSKKCLLQVKKRIGSDSSAGCVYQLNVVGSVLKAAAKIIPIFTDQDVENNANEVEIASILSRIVLRGDSYYFPIVYNVIECKNTIFSGFLKCLDPNVINMQILKDIHPMLTTKQIRDVSIMIRDCHIPTKIFIKKIKGIVGRDIMKKFNPKEIVIKCNIMISELAWGDLRQYIRSKSKSRYISKLVIYIMKEVFRAIYVLQSNNIVHDDLHTGNILIMINDRGILVPLIHDFGKSYINRNFSDIDYTRDIIDFLRSVENEMFTNVEVVRYVKLLRKYVIKYQGDYSRLLMSILKKY